MGWPDTRPVLLRNLFINMRQKATVMAFLPGTGLYQIMITFSNDDIVIAVRRSARLGPNRHGVCTAGTGCGNGHRLRSRCVSPAG